MNKRKFLLIGIILLSAVVRFVYLGRIPNGFIPEEVSTGWNAYSLLKTGRDEWGTLLPVIFRETGGFKLALNSYLIVPVMAVLGVNEFAVRFPTALAGVISVYLTYVLAKILWKKDSYALAAAALLAINPWFVSMGRYAVDVNWGIPLFLLGIIFFLKSKTQPKLFWMSAVCFALTYYTYFNFVVFTVLFLVGLFLINLRFWWVRKRSVLAFFLIQLLFLLPYIIQPNLTTRFSQATSVGKIGLTNQTNEHREACLKTYTPFICKALYNKVWARGLEIIRNYTNHYSTTTLFLHGSKLGLSGMPDGWGFFYLFEFVLLIIGFILLIRQGLFTPLLGLWLFLYGLPSALAGEHHIWRMMTLLPLPQLIEGVGLIGLVRRLRYRVTTVAPAAVIGFFVIRFVADYFSYFPYAQANYAYFGFRDLYKYLSEQEDKYPYILVAPGGLGFDQLYIYYLFYERPNPREYQQGKGISRQTGSQQWVYVDKIGKWHFQSDVRNIMTQIPESALLVADGMFNERQIFSGTTIIPTLIYTINYPTGDPAFKIYDLKRT